MSCTLIRLDPHNAGTIEKVKDFAKHGDLVLGKNIHKSGLYVVYKIDDVCDILKCDNGEYFPRVCNVIPTSITKYIKDPYNYYKQYFRYIQEINLNPIVHHNIIKQYVEPDSHYKYTLDNDSFYSIDENGYIDSYNIKTFKLEQSNISPFIGY